MICFCDLSQRANKFFWIFKNSLSIWNQSTTDLSLWLMFIRNILHKKPSLYKNTIFLGHESVLFVFIWYVLVEQSVKLVRYTNYLRNNL